MEIYEARDILESNGYLIERTPLEARTNDRFKIPKLSKVKDAKKERENALINLFKATTSGEFENAFRLLFNEEIGHEGIEIDDVFSRSDLNKITLKVNYNSIVNNLEYLEDKNVKIYNKMIETLNNLSPIQTNSNIKIVFGRYNFYIVISIEHKDETDTKKLWSELKKLKENIGEAMYDGIQKVTKIVKGFNSSYERAWEK